MKLHDDPILDLAFKRLLLAVEVATESSGHTGQATDEELAQAAGWHAENVGDGLQCLAASGYIWVFAPEETGWASRLIVNVVHADNVPILSRYPADALPSSLEIRAAVLGQIREAIAGLIA